MELTATLDALTVLGPGPREVSLLPGGLTNRNYAVTTGAGRFVVRDFSGDTGALAIDREHEYRNSVAAAQAGVGAPVHEFRPDLHVLVVGFVDGETCTDESLTRPGVIERVAAACRRLHAGPCFGNDFDMVERRRTYLSIVQRHGYRLPPRYLEHEPQMERLQAALRATPVATVPCHNDLLAGNLLDDGRRIRIIDYEYSGNNDPSFELGNLWSECHLEDDRLEELVTAYCGAPAPPLVARARLQAIMSKYGWPLWAAIQDAVSTIEFDFWEWGMEKYDGAEAMFADPRFDRWLDEVRPRA